jgi:hypothetical protein
MYDRASAFEPLQQSPVCGRIGRGPQGSFDDFTFLQIDDDNAVGRQVLVVNAAWFDRENPLITIGYADVPKRQVNQFELW